MFQRLRKHLTPSTFIALLALVFALTGGAFAASSHGGSSPTKATASITIATAAKAKPKAKTKAGPRGPAGPKGATGATGATGPAGATGPGGAQGAQGLAGPAGTVGSTGPQGVEGKAGKNGTTGFTKTLPSGETLKGDWSLTGPAAAIHSAGVLSTAVSFGIPLAAAPAAVHLIPAQTEQEEEEGKFPAAPTGCTGNFADPGADPGNLCVFAREESNIGENGGAKSICPAGAVAPPEEHAYPLHCVANKAGEGADPFGFDILVLPQAVGYVQFAGTWAVTAE